MYPYFTLLIVILFCGVIGHSFEVEKGPYEVVLHNTSRCAGEQPWFRANLSVYTVHGRTYLRGAGVFTKEIKDVKYRIRLYNIGDNNDKLKLFEIKNVNCRNVLVQLVLATAGVHIHSRQCAMAPTNWEFRDLNLNRIVHTLVPEATYGMKHARWEMQTTTRRLMCQDIFAEFVPLSTAANT